MKKINYKKENKFLKEMNDHYIKKNYKLRSDLNFWIPLGIIGLLTIITSLAYVFYNEAISPTYNITLKECHNESKTIGMQTIGYNLVYYNYSLEITDMQGLKRGLSDYEFNERYSDCEGITCFYSEELVVIRREKSNKTEPIVIPIMSQKEVCEDKEVNEIELMGSEYPCRVNGEKVICNILRKEEITNDWLKENAGCVLNTKCTDYNIRCKDGCQEWKVGDYRVEVIK